VVVFCAVVCGHLPGWPMDASYAEHCLGLIWVPPLVQSPLVQSPLVQS